MEGLSALSKGLSFSPAVSAKELFYSALNTVQLATFLIPPYGKYDCGKTTFDFIIVGAGSAGSIVANRLTENKDVSVLLVEAGDEPPLTSILPAYFELLPRTKWDWNFESTKSDAHQCHRDNTVTLPQGKMLGGGSSFNWMCYVTGDPHDYDNWAEIANDESWNYDNILPLFKLNEDLRDEETLNSPNRIYHGTGGSIGVTRQQSRVVDKYLAAFKELGNEIVVDTDGRNILGFSHLLLNIADGVRQSTAHSFLKPAKDRSNLCILKNSLATKILFDNDKNAVGIEIVNVNNNKQTFLATKEVIISAGTINTAKLLLLSGVGPKKHLDEMEIPVIADLPVGENFQDHVPVLHAYVTDANYFPNLPLNPHEFPQPIFIGNVAMNKSQTYPDYQVLGSIIDAEMLFLVNELTTTYKQSIIKKFYVNSKGRHVFFLYASKLNPKSRGRVFLRSTNPRDDPAIDLGMYTDKDDLNDAIRYSRDVGRILNTKLFNNMGARILKPPGCEDFDVNTEEYWSCHVRCLSASFYHYVGTCSMGLVVDSRLRVYEVKKLRVVDGSIMPTVTSGNTNVPIMMIGQKGADMIKEEYNY